MTRWLSETRAGSGNPELTSVALMLNSSPSSSSTTRTGLFVCGIDSIYYQNNYIFYRQYPFCAKLGSDPHTGVRDHDRHSNAPIAEMKAIRGTTHTIYVKLKCENSQWFSTELVCNLLILNYLLVICKLQKRLARYPVLVIC
jgi:hypothetical protein